MASLTKQQIEKFTKGYNVKVAAWNSDMCDGGQSPFRRSSWMYIGYEAARSQVTNRLFNGETNIKLEPITREQAQQVYNALHN